MDNTEKARDIRKAEVCAICGEKLGKIKKFVEQNYVHMLSDAAPCQECSLKLWRLLMYKKWWVEDEEYKQVIGTSYNYRNDYSVPLEKAKEILVLRDTVNNRITSEVGLEQGNSFVVQEVFKMPPRPAIFILRARKVRNKMVVGGFILKGTIKKDDSVLLKVGASVKKVKILDVIPKGTLAFKKETFWSELEANIHNHTLTECNEGWMILDIEEQMNLEKGMFIAGCTQC